MKKARKKKRPKKYACGECGVMGHNAQSHRPARSDRTRQRRKSILMKRTQMAFTFPPEAPAGRELAAA